MDYEDVPVSSNFIPCVKWVKKGVAKEIPEKIELSKEELQDIIDKTKSELSTVKEEENEENKEAATAGKEIKENITDEYNFDKYDYEDADGMAFGIGNITICGDSYVTQEDDSDSEKEDDVIRPNDNLILVGRAEGDAGILEVYVYNENEGSLYVHHDLFLPSVPLCLDWLDYDPGEGRAGNLCAIGSLSPVIEIWDIDVLNCVEPAFKLGKRGQKKKGIKKYGHKDAVLGVSWNRNVKHVLASGSADQTVLLWDLDTGKYASKLTSFQEKVQTLQWHPFEGETLLVGSCDSTARIFDCRAQDSHKDWIVNGEVESVLWNHFNSYNFIVGTSNGCIYYIDCRNKKPLWELKAHNTEVSGVSLSSQCPGLLITAGADANLKVWDIMDETPFLVYCKKPNVGSLLCLDACPDLPFVVSVGGDKKDDNFTVFDVMNSTAVQNRFMDRDLVCAVKTEAKDESDGEMETSDAMFDYLSLKIKQEPGTSKPVKKEFKTGLVCAVKTEVKDESDGEMETSDAMFDSLPLEIKQEPGTSKPVKKEFKTGALKMKKKKKLKRK